MRPDADEWIEGIVQRMPIQGSLIVGLREIVKRTEEFRGLGMSCSFGRGNPDEWSDVDAHITHTITDAQQLTDAATTLTAELGEVVDVRVHPHDGFGEPTRRAAAIFADGGQLDLVLLPAGARPFHIVGEEIVIVDKDDELSRPHTRSGDQPTGLTADRAVEYVHSAWWFLRDVAKYLHRRSWFEAVERLGVARDHMMRLVAIGARATSPQYGLISVLDFTPAAIPARLADTYALPNDPDSIIAAALALADLIDDATRRAEESVGQSLRTAIADEARLRLAAVDLS